LGAVLDACVQERVSLGVGIPEARPEQESFYTNRRIYIMGVTSKKGKQRSTPTLKRITFQTSRLLDFCTPKTLTTQTGHPVEEWPLVQGKETMDNSLDNCEEHDIVPRIQVFVDETGYTIKDNGSGIPPSTVEGLLDFRNRVSSREAYVSPTRGAQGNALQTLIPMPFALDGREGCVEIEALGHRHVIRFRVDQIAQKPVIDHHHSEEKSVDAGTKIVLHWPPQHRQLLEKSKERVLRLMSNFTVLNAHLNLSVSWFGEQLLEVSATTEDWKKWRPNAPTSSHWYNQERIERLIGAQITYNREHAEDEGGDHTVRAFMAKNFDGLTASATQKKVLDTTGLSRAKLTDLTEDGQMRSDLIAALLKAMQDNTKEVTHDRLGKIGKPHLECRFKGMGCEMESFKYKIVKGKTDRLPWVLETAFGWCPELNARRLITGVNWSAAIINPFRSMGEMGALDSLLSELRIYERDPVAVVVHVACPRVEYRDHGKSAISIGGLSEDVSENDLCLEECDEYEE
jgi:DNA topoisomerase VI subunit B